MPSPVATWIDHLNERNAAAQMPRRVRYRNGGLLWLFAITFVAVGLALGIRQSASGSWTALCLWTGLYFTAFFGRLTLYPRNPGAYVAWLTIGFIISCFPVMAVGGALA